MQCHQGHAVCEKCYLKLKECPHCRSLYVGTRNFVLEELITKLKGLTFNKSPVANTENVPENNGAKNTNEAPDYADRPVNVPLMRTPPESPSLTNQLEMSTGIFLDFYFMSILIIFFFIFQLWQAYMKYLTELLFFQHRYKAKDCTFAE